MGFEDLDSSLLAVVAGALASVKPECAGIELLPSHSLSGDLALTSLQVMKVALAIEKQLDIEIEESAEFRLRTVLDLVEYLQSRIDLAESARTPTPG
jgi:acyl carrier protein